MEEKNKSNAPEAAKNSNIKVENTTFPSIVEESSAALIEHLQKVSLLVDFSGDDSFHSLSRAISNKYSPVSYMTIGESQKVDLFKSDTEASQSITVLNETIKKTVEPFDGKESKLYCGVAKEDRSQVVHWLKNIRNQLSLEDRVLLRVESGAGNLQNTSDLSQFEIEALGDCIGFSLLRSWNRDNEYLFLLSPSQPFVITAEDIILQMRSAWKFSDSVFDLLKPAGIFQQPISLRHPFLFYLGHLPAFANNQVANALVKHNPSHFDVIFERGIDPDVNDPTKCHSHSELPPQWPEVREVLEYRQSVRENLMKSINRVLEMPEMPRMVQKGRVFSMIAEHDYMHAETLLYMYNNLGSEYKEKQPAERLNYQLQKSTLSKGETVTIPKGKVIMGANYKDIRFGWDNEFPEKEEEVEQFNMDVLPVTNGEFMVFVECGEYENPKHWKDDNFQWKEKIGLKHPHSWHYNLEKSQWEIKTIDGSVPMEMAVDWPVYVSHAEAQAYCNFVGKRLPTESEYHRAAYGTPEGIIRKYPWGDEEPKAGVHGNFDFYSMAPVPVGSHPKGQSAFGIYELVGNGWEWTISVFDGFPGFQQNIPSYLGYSADFFDGKHYVMLGASWATATPLIRRSFRNWFQSNYQYTFSKFRCVSQ